jgi:WD40 repeat protein
MYFVQLATVAPDGRTVFLGTIGPQENRVWGPSRFGPQGATFPTGFNAAAAVFTPDGSGLVTFHRGEKGPNAGRWDLTGDAPRLMPGWGEPTLRQPICAAIGPDGRRLLVGCRDGAILLDETTGRAVGEKLGTTAAVTAVAFRADGVAAIGGQDGTIRLWDPAHRTTSGQTMQSSGGITSLAFKADGSILLAGSNDGTARFWDTGTGLPIGPPLRHRRAVQNVRFAPDGRTALTAGADGMVLRWRVPEPPAQVSVDDLAVTIRQLTRMELGPDDVPRGLTDE